MVRALQEKAEKLTQKVREFGITLPLTKADVTLVCPSYTKSIEANHMLLEVIDATQYLMNQV
jgi:predicted nucleotide-binding protein (sugar kinase/HSP70/actin superfamily)